MPSCPRCDATTPPDARFCPQCAAPLQQRETGERRVVTVLFCDVQGSTALAESRDPEDWAEIMDGAFAVLIPEIERLEGTVVRLLGDAILAFFGAPVAHEDDPERALLAALAVQRATTEYAARVHRERGVRDFAVRVGVNTGLAVLTDIGAGGRVEYTAMGDAVNIAARLQGAAPPGGIVASEATVHAAGPRFVSTALGALEIRGRSASVVAHLVTGHAAHRDGGGGLLVGRRFEVAEMRRMLDEVLGGRGRVVSIVGEPGMGKSRLVAELHEDWTRLARSGAPWLVARGQSYARLRSFAMARPLLLALCSTDEERPPAEQRAMLGLALDGLPDAPRAAAAIAYALGIGDPTTELEGEALADEIVRAARLLVERALTGGPVALVFDDLHWCDQASADLLLRLVNLADSGSLLLVLAYRPDRQSSAWRVRQRLETELPHRSSEIALRPLERVESEALLQRMLGGRALTTASELLAKAEGNPFFLEELCRSVLERDEGAPIHLPETLHGLLASRIDRLPEGPRRVLQAASVIGRTFGRELLQAVTGETDLGTQISHLLRAEMVDERAGGAERGYAFRHPLLQEAAYASLLQRRRRELHVRVADALAVTHAEDASDLVAHHLAEAGDARAPEALRGAGDRALRLYALSEAAEHYHRALAVAHANTPTALLAHLHRQRGRALEQGARYDEAISCYEGLRDLAVARSERGLEAEALLSLASIYGTPTSRGDPAKAEPLLVSAMTIAREIGDRALVAKLLWSQGWLTNLSGEFARGIALLDESIAIARELDLREQLATSLNDISHMLREAGQLDRAIATVREAQELFRASGNQVMVADGHSTIAYGLYYLGRYDESLAESAIAWRISDETNNLWGHAYSLIFGPDIHFEQGDWGAALNLGKDALRLSTEANFVPGQLYAGSELGAIYTAAGDPDAAIELLRGLPANRPELIYGDSLPTIILAHTMVTVGRLDEAAELLDDVRRRGTVGAAYGQAWFDRTEASLELARGNAQRALEVTRGGLARLRTLGFRPLAADLLLLEGEALEQLGEVEASRATYREARADAAALGSRRNLPRAHAALGELAEARAILDGIAESLRPVGLADAFRRLPANRAILESPASG